MQQHKLENKLYVTKTIPEDATILLVDLQQKHFDEVLDNLDTEERIRREVRLSKRLNTMAERLRELNEEGIDVYAIVDNDGLHPKLKELSTKHLPDWFLKYNPEAGDSCDPADLYIMHPEIISEMKGKTKVIVCGLWKELCVLSVTRLLQKEGIAVSLYTGSDLTFENAIIWDEEDTDAITLESECEELGLNIIELN